MAFRQIAAKDPYSFKRQFCAVGTTFRLLLRRSLRLHIVLAATPLPWCDLKVAITAGIIDRRLFRQWTPKLQTEAAYLEFLNPEQRRAVEDGSAERLAAAPLLVIAGAGSGKTNTSPIGSPI